MITVYYENHLGEIIDLKKEPYRLITGTFLNYEWEESSGSYLGFNRKVKKKTMKMDIFTDKTKYHAAIDYLYEVFEKDILANSPGKLHFCGSYLNCYITVSEKSNWESDIFMTLSLNLLTDGVWMTEVGYVFENRGITSSNNKFYPGKYPYRYANGMNNTYIINPHFADSNFKLILYGPVVNPQISIGGNIYLVNIVLEANERLEIDSSLGTVIKVMSTGEQVSAFHNRQKKRNFFKKIPPGRQSVVWPGNFAFDLILYEERSEPKWNTLQQL